MEPESKLIRWWKCSNRISKSEDHTSSSKRFYIYAIDANEQSWFRNQDHGQWSLLRSIHRGDMNMILSNAWDYVEELTEAEANELIEWQMIK